MPINRGDIMKDPCISWVPPKDEECEHDDVGLQIIYTSHIAAKDFAPLSARLFASSGEYVCPRCNHPFFYFDLYNRKFRCEVCRWFTTIRVNGPVKRIAVFVYDAGAKEYPFCDNLGTADAAEEHPQAHRVGFARMVGLGQANNFWVAAQPPPVPAGAILDPRVAVEEDPIPFGQAGELLVNRAREIMEMRDRVVNHVENFPPVAEIPDPDPIDEDYDLEDDP